MKDSTVIKFNTRDEFESRKKQLVQKALNPPETKSTCSMTSSIAATYTNSYTWKSKSTYLANEFSRIQRLVRYVAPEQFRIPARPTRGPCKIVPMNILEYVEHRKALLEMQTQQMEKNLRARKEANRIAKIDRDGERQKPIKSKFDEDGKVYTDGLSTVLSQPTMWTHGCSHFQAEQAEWPTQTELQECGDRRENDQIATRCGRYLPPPTQKVWLPREGTYGTDRGNLQQGYIIKRMLSFDEPGPIFRQGPSPMEITDANAQTDNDPTFEYTAHGLLGEDLMEEIGDWKAPFTPDWLMEKRRLEMVEQAIRAQQPHIRWILPMVPLISY